MFVPGWRERAFASLAEPLDVLVIGGGISGAGIFHDAALRGLRVGLVERGDFACGTSSRSSKLIHGGLRYLRRMQLGITRTACRERDLLVLSNPHLVWPVRFLYPSYAHDATPGWQVNLGLAMYDHLTPAHHRHEQVETTAALDLAPLLAEPGLEFGLVYDDAAADDARLVLAVIMAGMLAGGSAVNYAPVEELCFDRAKCVCGARVRDLESGAMHEARAHVVVNATGVWCDEVRALAGERSTRLRPSRGSHLLFPQRRLPLDLAVTALSPDDGRPVFSVPHPEGTLVGTTDLFHFDALETPRPNAEEVTYLLRFAQHTFPAARLKRNDIVGAFAGVRPVLSSTAATPSAASREEAVWEEHGMLSTAGGKLTTFRATAEKVTNAAVELLPEQRRHEAGPVRTAAVALPWCCRPSAAVAALVRVGVTHRVADGLVRRLGALALPLVGIAEREALQPLADTLDCCAAELVWHMQYGGVVHLEDLLLRRVRLGVWQPRRCLELAPSLRSTLRRAVGWSVARWNAELRRLETAVANWMPPDAA